MAERSQTLIEIVQGVGELIGAPEIDSIDDADEAHTIAQIAVNVYEEMAEESDFPHLFKLRELEVDSGTATNPTRYKIPADVARVDNLWYDTTLAADAADSRRELEWLEPDEFVELTNARNTEASNTAKFTVANSVELFLINDAQPLYYTSFDDVFIFLDSWVATEDTFVASSKSAIWCKEIPELVLADGSVINMPNKLMPTFKARVRALSMFLIKNQKDPFAVQEYSRGKIKNEQRHNKRAMQRTKRRKRGRAHRGIHHHSPHHH